MAAGGVLRARAGRGRLHACPPEARVARGRQASLRGGPARGLGLGGPPLSPRRPGARGARRVAEDARTPRVRADLPAGLAPPGGLRVKHGVSWALEFGVHGRFFVSGSVS